LPYLQALLLPALPIFPQINLTQHFPPHSRIATLRLIQYFLPPAHIFTAWQHASLFGSSRPVEAPRTLSSVLSARASSTTNTLTETLGNDIVHHSLIYIPSRFGWNRVSGLISSSWSGLKRVGICKILGSLFLGTDHPLGLDIATISLLSIIRTGSIA
jgi:hypothetical protein